MSKGDLLHVASLRECNTQQTGQFSQQRMQQPCNKPASLKALAEGILSKVGRNSACNSDATALLHTSDSSDHQLQQVQKPAAAGSLSPEEAEDYTLADLKEMDMLLRELAKLEGWSEAELADKLDQRRRMAPINVPAALRLLRAGVAKAALNTDKPTKRVPGALCVIKGGKA